MTEIDGITQKQTLLAQHRQNLHYLTQQAAQYGLDLPLALHNALCHEQEGVAILERELAALGVSAQPEPQWQALVIDPDYHWRQIITQAIGQLGGAVVECPAWPDGKVKDLAAANALAVIGVPDASTRQWVKDVVKLGQRLPLILLAGAANRDTVIVLRQAIGVGSKPITTVSKDNFDACWFARVAQNILTQ
jgi:hypothetical protein